MNKFQSIFVYGLLVVALGIFAVPAMALDLNEARSKGLIGEGNGGYVKAITVRPDVGSLVDEVNAARKAEYHRIAAANGQPVDVVASLAAKQIIGKLKSGQIYQDGSGNWVKR